jgi:hypothetical protein
MRFKLPFLLLCGPLFFLWSNFLLAHYVGGDQVHYLRLWRALGDSGPIESLTLAKIHVTGVEPISALVLWLGANLGIEKNVYISLLNLVLGIGVFLLLSRYKAPWYFYLLVFSNFYLIVLMTGAERLKIAYLLLVFSSLLPKRAGFVLAVLSPLAHLQSIIVLASMATAKAIEPLKIFFRPVTIARKDVFWGVLFTLVVTISLLTVAEVAARKIAAFAAQSRGFSELLQISLLGLIGIYVTRDRLRMVSAFTPLAIAIYFLGGLRVNMIAVTVVLYLLLSEGRIKHPMVLLLMVYLSAKSIPFVNNILINGNGFKGYLF